MTERQINKEFVLAVNEDNLEKVKEFVELGADNNILCNIYGDTPLIISMVNGDFEMLKYLLSKGADPTIKNDANRNIFTYIKEIRKAVSIYGKHKDFVMLGWMMAYSTQKEILTKFPCAIHDLIKNKLILLEIQEEFKDLISGADLNLL